MASFPGSSSVRVRGFSLIEVLVAMLILGVAVLAFAGLQVRSLESTGVAHIRSQAMTLAAEFVERMRVNPAGMADYGNAGLYGAGVFPAGEPATWANSCALAVTNVNGCTSSQMARFDINEIQFLADQYLPLGRVFVDDCTGGGVMSCVFVSWGGVDPADCVDNASTNCVSMRVLVQ